MTIAVIHRIREQLLEEAIEELCSAKVYGAGKPDARSRKSREAKVRLYGRRFLDRMQGNAPFATEEEAIAALAPIAVWIFRLALRQLAIQVIEFLWQRWSQTATERR